MSLQARKAHPLSKPSSLSMIIPIVQPIIEDPYVEPEGCANTRERISARVQVASVWLPPCPLTAPLLHVRAVFCQATSEGKRKNN